MNIAFINPLSLQSLKYRAPEIKNYAEVARWMKETGSVDYKFNNDNTVTVTVSVNGTTINDTEQVRAAIERMFNAWKQKQ